MEIVIEYRKITEEIAIARSQMKSCERLLDKAIASCGPGEVKGFDFNKEPEYTEKKDIFSVAQEIYRLKEESSSKKRELESLYSQRNELEKTINELGDTKKRIAMLKIKGYPEWRIARELAYSERHVRRIWKEAKDVLLMS